MDAQRFRKKRPSFKASGELVNSSTYIVSKGTWQTHLSLGLPWELRGIDSGLCLPVCCRCSIKMCSMNEGIMNNWQFLQQRNKTQQSASNSGRSVQRNKTPAEPYDPAIPLLGICPEKTINQKDTCWASLVVQWLGICLPMQGIWVWALAWEDPTCHGVARPVSHNSWAWALETTSHNYWSLHA